VPAVLNLIHVLVNPSKTLSCIVAYHRQEHLGLLNQFVLRFLSVYLERTSSQGIPTVYPYIDWTWFESLVVPFQPYRPTTFNYSNCHVTILLRASYFPPWGENPGGEWRHRYERWRVLSIARRETHCFVILVDNINSIFSPHFTASGSNCSCQVCGVFWYFTCGAYLCLSDLSG
jgi:hypothetical protein